MTAALHSPVTASCLPPTKDELDRFVVKVARAVDDLRRKRGSTVPELADQIARYQSGPFTASMLRHRLRGETPFRLHELCALTDIFECDVRELLPGEGDL